METATARATRRRLRRRRRRRRRAAAGCQDVEAPDPREDGGETQPTEPLDPSKTWTLTFATSCGEFVVTLDVEGAPETAASLVALAEDGFYDDTVFHRIVPGS